MLRANLLDRLRLGKSVAEPPSMDVDIELLRYLEASAPGAAEYRRPLPLRPERGDNQQ